MYLIWSQEHKLWWKKPAEDGSVYGYTNDVLEAGRFKFHEAHEICTRANRWITKGEPLNEIMFPLPPFPMGGMRATS